MPLRVDACVAQKPLENVICELLGERAREGAQRPSSPSRTKTSRIVETPTSIASSGTFSFGACTLHSLDPETGRMVGSPIDKTGVDRQRAA